MDSSINQKRQPGYSDISWLKDQAVDKATEDFIKLIEVDQKELHENGTPTSGDALQRLNFKQGSFYTTRATAHSIAYIFVQIFQQKEHTQIEGFGPKNDQVVVDLGANEGFYSIYMAQAPGSKVIAVEANPIAGRIFRENITVNNAQNVSIIDAAISTSRGTATFSILPQVTSIGALVVLDTNFLSTVPGRMKTITVKTTTLADIIKDRNLKRIDILKIDIEGTELDILTASKTELLIVRRLVVEYHSKSICKSIEKLLKSQGFTLIGHVEDRPDFGDLYFEKLTNS